MSDSNLNDDERYLNDPEYRERIRKQFVLKSDRSNASKGDKSPSSKKTKHAVPRRSVPKMLVGIFGGIILVSLIGLAIFISFLVQGLPSIEELENPRTDVASFVLSRDGVVLDSYFVENRRYVTIDEISPHTINALIATEDHRFFDHWGIDMRRTLAIPYHVLRGAPQGGSTITQQLARNLYRSIGREVSVIRKLREMITAIQIERNYTKAEIIEMYLNTVEFSNSAFGIEAAARTHFNKPALELNVEESATLIGTLQAVSFFNPRLNPQNAQRRRNIVLMQMNRHGFLTDDDFTSLVAAPIALDYQRPRQATRQSRYFGEYVRLQVSRWAEENGYDLFRDGLVIRTTIDAHMQRHAERVVEQKVDSLQTIFVNVWGGDNGPDRFMPRYQEQFPHHIDGFLMESGEFQQLIREEGLSREQALQRLRQNRELTHRILRSRMRLESGFVAIEPGTGHVLAWVGGTDFSTIQRDNVSQLRRQAGSTFKPFVYALAIDNGYMPYHEFSRFPVSFRDRSGNVWAPNDIRIAPGPEYVSMRESIARSLNNVTVRMLPELAGAPGTDNLEDLFPAARQIADMARNMGIRSRMEAVPAIALGTAEVNLLELVNSYATFANNGVYMDPLVIMRIEDREGNVLFEAPPQMQQEVMSPLTAYTMIDMMRGVISGGEWGHGTGIRFRNMGIRQDVAGKTGTTNRAVDTWFVSVFPHVVAGSWVGGEDARIRFPQGSVLGQGARTALPIVAEWALRVINDDNGNWSFDAFTQPPGFVPDPPRDQRPQPQDSDNRGRVDW
ncbi:penicillin-binding protein 1A [Cyclonatronum proteinivorum]|uniref:Penicillin-binding protein 1A n=1 Tax=Cyclonatronum proteinivorum TaxID=1457365 RepID=A0A345UM25_9BACT|nr:transglycosylase domain-containing protein [Cyclonatronum proteinivorum]AXJ01527.1 penicillin-binding protein 1A [Cyclonatronum proteinivorum]